MALRSTIRSPILSSQIGVETSAAAAEMTEDSHLPTWSVALPKCFREHRLPRREAVLASKIGVLGLDKKFCPPHVRGRSTIGLGETKIPARDEMTDAPTGPLGPGGDDFNIATCLSR